MYVKLIREYVDVRINFKKQIYNLEKIRTYNLKNMVLNMYLHRTYDLKNMACQQG